MYMCMYMYMSNLGSSLESAQWRSRREEPHAIAPIQPATAKSTGRFHRSGKMDGFTWS